MITIADRRAESRCRYYVREEAQRLGWDIRHPNKGGLFLEEQEIVNYFPSLKNFLGNDRPDFCALGRNHDLKVVIECKSDIKQLGQAWLEAQQYADTINQNKDFNVRMAIGVAGTPDKFVQTQGYFLKAKNQWVQLESHGYPLTQLPTLDELETALQKSDGTTDVQLPDEREFFDAAINLNRILRLAKIPETTRPKILGAIIVALYKGKFDYASDTVLEHINVNVRSAIRDFKGIEIGKKDLLIEVLKLHDAESLKIYIPAIIHQLERLNIRSIMRSGVDFLGKFYEAFLRYGSSEGKGMGIVFTPRHITKYCSELTQVKLGMKIYDPAAGTGGFLVAAFDDMMNQATTEKAKELVRQSLYGNDTDETVWALSILNMFFRGDGKSHIEFKSCFDNEEQYFNQFDRVLLNPPFSLEGEPETKFIDHALNSLKAGGEMAVVVKTNVLVDPDLAYWRRNLVLNHHVLAVISLPVELFYPTSAPTVILIVRAFLPNKNQGTFLARIKNDGYEISKKRRIETNGSQLDLVKSLYRNFLLVGRIDSMPNLAFIVERNKILDGQEICAEQWLPSENFGINEFNIRRQESIQQMTLSVANYPEITDELIYNFDSLLMDGLKKGRPVKKTRLNDWFYIENGKSSGHKNYPGGSIPYISSGDENNSIVSFIEPVDSEIYDIPCITVTAFGMAYIQPWRFAARGNGGSSVRVLKPKFGMSLSELTWFTGQINDQRWRFNYGRMATKGRLISLIVDPPLNELPILSNLQSSLCQFRSEIENIWSVQSFPTAKDKFNVLALRWKVEKLPTSSALQMSQHPAYREIIAMGNVSIPFILTELNKEPDHWFIALSELTGANPITPDASGNIKLMAECWLDWAKQNGINY